MKMIQKTTVSERIHHWLMMVSFFMLAWTGFGFAFHSLNWMNEMFGSAAVASTFHKWGGLIFFYTVLVSLGSYAAEAMSYGDEDKEWMDKKGGYLGEKLTLPQGKMNFGQKLFYVFVVVASGIAVSITGILMWMDAMMGFSHFVHYLAFMAMIIAMPIHIYLATAGNPGTFRIMTRGTVPLEWARKRYGKWVKEAGF